MTAGPSSSSLARVTTWLESFVIGLDICPFARKPWESGLVHLTLSPATTQGNAFEAFAAAVDELHKMPRNERSTSLVIFDAWPDLDFGSFMDLVASCNDYLDATNREGLVQIAHFHPHYHFQGHDKADHVNFLGRAPFPILHILREEEVDEAQDHPLGLKAILTKNMDTVKKTSREDLEALAAGVKA